MALTTTPIELSSTPSIVDGGNATAITIDSSENVIIGSGNSSITLSTWDANKSDIAALTSSSDFGGLIEGGENGSLVLGIQDNDNTDAVYIISGSGNYMTDSTYDKVVLKAAASGNISTGGSLEITGNITGVTDLYVDDQIISTGDTDTYMQFHQADGWRVVTGGSERFHIQGNQVVINHDGHDADFRVESDTNAHALFVNGGNNSVGINTSSPDGALTVVGTTTSGDMIARFQHSVNDNDVKVIRVNAPNSSGTHGYVDIGVDPETTQGGLAVSTSSGGLLAGNANLNNAAIIWDSSKRVTMPSQPAFLVRPSSTQSNIANNSTQVQIAFGTEIFDQSSNFSSNVFTAPVTGKYQFNLTLYLTGFDVSASYYAMYISTSNNNYELINSGSVSGASDPAYRGFGWSCLADMDANDTAQIHITQAGGAAQTDVTIYSRFSGFLAC